MARRSDLATFPGRAALSVYISYSQSRSFGLTVATRHRQSLGLTIYDRSPALNIQTYSAQDTLLLLSGERDMAGVRSVDRSAGGRDRGSDRICRSRDYPVANGTHPRVRKSESVNANKMISQIMPAQTNTQVSFEL